MIFRALSIPPLYLQDPAPNVLGALIVSLIRCRVARTRAALSVVKRRRSRPGLVLALRLGVRIYASL